MRLATQPAESMIVTSVVPRTTHVFATFVPIDFTIGYAIDRLWGSAPCLRTGVEGVKNASTSIEALMTELRAASADLAKSAAIGTSRMVLRSKLSNAIRDAEKAERAAENLRAAASAIVSGHQQTGLVPDPTPDIEMEDA